MRDTFVLPVTPPLLAEMVPLDTDPGAVNVPAPSMLPMVLLQVKLAGVTLPNWSRAVAVNNCCAFVIIVGFAGVTVMLATCGALVRSDVLTRSIASYVTDGCKY